MAGILDNKSRVLDVLVTSAGRQQLARGDLRLRYVAFSDQGTWYRGDVASGSSDATNRLYFEACNLPQDQVTFTADDSGKLMPFSNELAVQVKDGKILSYSFPALTGSVVSGSLENVEVLSGSEFASTSMTLIASSLENFKKLNVVSSKNFLFEDDGFGVSPRQIEFTITNDRPVNSSRVIANLTHVESLFNDPRLSRLKNFAYLPPINKIDDSSVDKRDYTQTRQRQLGSYPPWNSTDPLRYEQLQFELDSFGKMGFVKDIVFTPTSAQNKLLAQFFERNFDTLKKLDVVDFGKHKNSVGDQVHVFFVGKIFIDENDTHSFVHLFTLVFH